MMVHFSEMSIRSTALFTQPLLPRIQCTHAVQQRPITRMKAFTQSSLHVVPAKKKTGHCPPSKLSLSCSKSAVATDLMEASTESTPNPNVGMMMRMWYYVRAAAFVFVAFAFSSVLFTVMLLATPFVFLFDRNRRSFFAFINTFWAKLTSFLFYRVQVEGRNNLPSTTEPAVYVANHQSFMDIFALFFLDRPIKFISKTSIFFFPFFGWSMFLTGHVRLNRVDRHSQLKCLRDCQSLLEKGVPIVFFPEGTRSADKTIQPFKKGAFTIAVKTSAPIVPITLIGTGDLMPKGKEFELRPGTVRVVVHPRIESKGRDSAELRNEAQSIVASAL